MTTSSSVEGSYKRTRSWEAFIAWAICGGIWASVGLAALSVGGVVLPLAVLLTILLTREGLSPVLRTWVWFAFAGWIIWWLLVLFRIADATSVWMVHAAFGFLLSAVVAGPAVAGLMLGLGLSAVFAGSGGQEPALVWVGFGVLGSAAAVITFVLLRKRLPIGFGPEA